MELLSGQDLWNLIGEDPRGIPNNLMPYVAQVAVGQRERLQVFGTDYPTPDGSGVRDYIHVVDLADAHVLGLQGLMADRIKPQALNLGTGIGYSVREVIDTAKRITGVDFRVEEAGRRSGDPPVLLAAVERAREVLGWRAKHSALDQIVASAWNWHRRRKK